MQLQDETSVEPGRPKANIMSFIPDLSVILAFAAAAFVLAITPGPDMALQMSRAINNGFWHGIAVGLGAMSGVVVHTTLAAVGVSVLIVAAPAAFVLDLSVIDGERCGVLESPPSARHNRWAYRLVGWSRPTHTLIRRMRYRT